MFMLWIYSRSLQRINRLSNQVEERDRSDTRERWKEGETMAREGRVYKGKRTLIIGYYNRGITGNCTTYGDSRWKENRRKGMGGGMTSEYLERELDGDLRGNGHSIEVVRPGKG